MAKCDLAIEIQDPDRVYRGGETVRGQVVVKPHAEVNCKALTICTAWATHGRGNIDRREVASQVVHQGVWQPGNEYRYSFELPCGKWPPTVHGNYLNVDHYVEATVDVPWAVNPKAAVPFQVAATEGPESIVKAKNVVEIKGAKGCAIALAIPLVVIGIMAAVDPILALAPFGFAAIIALIAFTVWFFKKFLPARRIGNVRFVIDEKRLAPGGVLRGTVSVEPRSRVSVDGIAVKVVAEEKCISGSGSNRRTHTHRLFEQTVTLAGASVLQPLRENEFNFEFQLPDQPYYSLQLDDNDLNWTATLCIEIPRWPDWNQVEKLEVLPADLLSDTLAGPGSTPSLTPEAAAGEAPSVSFAETVQMVWTHRDDPELRSELVDAVRDLPMQLTAIVERRLLSERADDEHAYPGGHMVWANFPDPPMPLTLYVPNGSAQQFEQLGQRTWKGEGRIVGWDHRHGRLQVRVE